MPRDRPRPFTPVKRSVGHHGTVILDNLSAGPGRQLDRRRPQPRGRHRRPGARLGARRAVGGRAPRWPAVTRCARSPIAARTASRRCRPASVVDGELQCGYHGWRFDADGRRPRRSRRSATAPRCRHAPASRAPFAVTEHLGLVWIAVDRTARRRCPSSSASTTSEFRVGVCETVRTPVSAVQLIDNFMDAAHFPFVHTATFGVDGAFDVANDEIVRDGWVVRSTFSAPYQNHDDPGVHTGEHPLIQDHTVTKVGHAGCNASLELRFPVTDGVFGIVYALQPETATSTAGLQDHGAQRRRRGRDGAVAEGRGRHPAGGSDDPRALRPDDPRARPDGRGAHQGGPAERRLATDDGGWPLAAG